MASGSEGERGGSKINAATPAKLRSIPSWMQSRSDDEVIPF